ncbi:MAG: DnaJ domain-containing protein [Desulfobacteraceae bacterium]|jgi:DnaJ like chaperone protein|nr:DnaJ domain-containing protein [Desulfobacteraceae bacterium]
MIRWILGLLGLLYVISPVDLLPDMMVLRGWIDDLFVLYLLYRYYLKPFLGARQSFRRSSPRADDTTGTGSRTDANAQDPYRVLGLSADATAEEIHRAYRQLAAKYHPDKVAHLGEEFRRLAEQRFKEIQAAYQTLKQRRRL